MYRIELYEDKNGKSEIKDYLQKLNNNKSKSNRIKLNKIRFYINLLKQEGFNLNSTYIKHLDSDIWELRPIRDRILFASLNNNIFILLNVFMKNTQKTPKKELEKAKLLLEDYKKRSEIK